MKSFIELDHSGKYRQLLSAVAKLSGLFSESSIPYIDYRLIENIFCQSFAAKNLSRSDTAFDASKESLGIGLKTFTCTGNEKTEKIAEFNRLSSALKEFKGKALAVELAKFRNERIELAQRTYDIKNSVYHIVARRDKELLLFETDYDKIDIDTIHSIRTYETSLKFEDNNNEYSFNYSKSTLYRKFIIPNIRHSLPVEIIENPYDLLLKLFNEKVFEPQADTLVQGVNYIILPLYSTRGRRYVPDKSGLNQWNAEGRPRDFGEVYIPIPIQIHRLFPNFFPSRNTYFKLKVPTGDTWTAKVCQDNSKALMTNPNNALSDWLLRKLLKLKEGDKATIEKLDELGFDSVIIYKDDNNHYRIDKAKIGSYERFINGTYN